MSLNVALLLDPDSTALERGRFAGASAHQLGYVHVDALGHVDVEDVGIFDVDVNDGEVNKMILTG